MNGNLTRLKDTPQKNHRNQMITQVWLPLGIILLAILGLFVIILLGAESQPSSISQIASISEILLIIPFFLIGLFQLILIILSFVLIKRISNGISPLASKIHSFILRIQLISENSSHSVASPIVGIRSSLHAIKYGLNKR